MLKGMPGGMGGGGMPGGMGGFPGLFGGMGGGFPGMGGMGGMGRGMGGMGRGAGGMGGFGGGAPAKAPFDCLQAGTRVKLQNLQKAAVSAINRMLHLCIACRKVWCQHAISCHHIETTAYRMHIRTLCHQNTALHTCLCQTCPCHTCPCHTYSSRQCVRR